MTEIRDSKDHNNSSTEDEFLADVLDQLLNAIQTGDLAEKKRLLTSYPALIQYIDCLHQMDQLIPQQNSPLQYSNTPSTARNAGQSSTGTSLAGGMPLGDFANGRYELICEIDRGGMGVVYRARQRDLDRVVAIKTILANHSPGPEEVARFQSEARAIARLSHRNIVPIHDIGEDQGRHFFVMDFVEGRSLSTLLRAESISTDQTIQWMIQIAKAVHYLHQRGIVHRDLKPSNILIDSEGQPVITDFGLAKVFDTDSLATRPGVILGTPSYMSPEQASGRHQMASPRSDVYSLGAVLYELLTGKPPFREATPFETLVQVLEKDPVPPRHLRKEIPNALELICLKCLEKDPEQRYETAAEFAGDLEALQHGEPLKVREGGWMQSLFRWTRREPGLAFHLATQLIAAIIIQIQYAFSTTTAVEHGRQITVLGVWAILSIVWAGLLKIDRWAVIARIGTILTDACLLTTALGLSTDHEGTLLVFYPLLIVVSGFSLREYQVWLTTAASLFGYTVLLLVRDSLRIPWHFPPLVMITFAATGISIAWQVNRIRRFGRTMQ